jgi:hypothetical protein
MPWRLQLLLLLLLLLARRRSSSSVVIVVTVLPPAVTARAAVRRNLVDTTTLGGVTTMRRCCCCCCRCRCGGCFDSTNMDNRILDSTVVSAATKDSMVLVALEPTMVNFCGFRNVTHAGHFRLNTSESRVEKGHYWSFFLCALGLHNFKVWLLVACTVKI